MEHSTIEWLIRATVASVCLLTFKRNPQVSIALALSLCGRYFFNGHSQGLYSLVTLFACGAICLFTIKDGLPDILELKGNEINHAVSYLYTLRCIVDSLELIGWSGVELSLIMSVFLLALQLLLATGDGVGYGTRINSFLDSFGNRVKSAIFQ
jgi:hypothetical protein